MTVEHRAAPAIRDPKTAGAPNATVTAALHELVREGRVERGPGGRDRFLGAVSTRTLMPTASANAQVKQPVFPFR